MSGPCDHEWYLDIRTRVRFMTCYCYCGNCYDHVLLLREGNGCIDDNCFCRQQPNGDCRATTAAHIYDSEAEKLPNLDSKPVEVVIKDLPENPGKTGTCRECKGPTYRNGTRGRFPTTCEGCKK